MTFASKLSTTGTGVDVLVSVGGGVNVKVGDGVSDGAIVCAAISEGWIKFGAATVSVAGGVDARLQAVNVKAKK